MAPEKLSSATMPEAGFPYLQKGDAEIHSIGFSKSLSLKLNAVGRLCPERQGNLPGKTWNQHQTASALLHQSSQAPR